MAKKTTSNVKCSFCGKMQDEVERIVAGPGVYICNECIDVCSNIVENDAYEDEDDEKYTINNESVPTPKEIKDILDEYVIGQEEAKKTLNKKLEVESEKLAIIPTEYQTEILCYEFKGKVNNKNYIVYINAENGREEDILLVVDTGNGTLTM